MAWKSRLHPRDPATGKFVESGTVGKYEGIGIVAGGAAVAATTTTTLNPIAYVAGTYAGSRLGGAAGKRIDRRIARRKAVATQGRKVKR